MDLSPATWALSWAAGALTTLSPCVFPLLPLVLGGALQANRLSPLAMGAGMALSFALIGLLFGTLGSALDIDSEQVRAAGAWVLAALGLAMLIPAASARFSTWMLPIASTANAASQRLQGGTPGSALLLGGVMGLVWTPCSGPLLASALTLVASEGGAVRGTLVLGLFGLGAATPLVAVAYASRQGVATARNWLSRHIEAIKRLFGIVLMLTGVAILTGADKWLEARIVTLLPTAWVRLTVGI